MPDRLLHPDVTDASRFALALDRMDGIGRVTAGRLLAHFATYDDLLRYPREQVLARIQGAPRAEALVARLFDRSEMDALLVEAREALDRLDRRGIHVIAPPDPSWPTRLAGLPRGRRPFLLYGYGPLDVLARPCVAFFARTPLPEAAFDLAQALVHHLLPHGIVPVTGASHGFDVVIHKLCHAGAAKHPSLLVAAAGMAKAPAPLRPTISAAVRAGGLFLSAFPLQHGPFEHDDRDRALLQAALAAASVFFTPEVGTPEWDAMTWALDQARPVFGVAAPAHPLPEAVHPLHTPVDFDWVLAAVQTHE